MVESPCPLYRQTGIAAFRKDFLHAYANLAPTALEIVESIDFMRIIGHRFAIKGVIHDRISLGVDRPQDVEKVQKELKEDALQKELFERVKLG